MGFFRKTSDIESRITNSPSKTVFAVVAATLALSAVLNVTLARRLQNLTNAQWMRSNDRLLNVGAPAPPITAKRLGREEETISYLGTNRTTVLYVFRPGCVWCARNLANLKALTDKENAQYRFVGLSTSEQDLREYVDKTKFAFPVYSRLSAETKAAYKLSGTPETIVVSSDGRVLQNWLGAYSGDRKAQVEAFFHTTLPGLITVPEPSSAVSSGK